LEPLFKKGAFFRVFKVKKIFQISRQNVFAKKIPANYILKLFPPKVF